MPVDEEFDRWMKIAEWRGRTIKALEEIDGELTEIKKDIREIMNQGRKRDMRVAGIAGSVSVIIVVFSYILPSLG